MATNYKTIFPATADPPKVPASVQMLLWRTNVRTNMYECYTMTTGHHKPPLTFAIDL